MSDKSDKHPRVEFNEELGQLVSTEPICADLEGNIVPCDDPAANTQIAGAGAPIPPKTAKRYGLAAGKEGRGGGASGAEAKEPAPARPAEEAHDVSEGKPAVTERKIDIATNKSPR